MNYNNFSNNNNEDRDSKEMNNQSFVESFGCNVVESNTDNNSSYPAIIPLAPSDDYDKSSWSMPSGQIEHNSYNPQSHPKSKSKKYGILPQMLAVSLISSIIGGVVTGFYFQFSSPSVASAAGAVYSSQYSGTESSQSVSSQFSTISLETPALGVSTIAEKAGPSIIGIKTTFSSRGMIGLQQGGGEGSGIIYTSDGYIVTNYHVIEGAVDTSSKSVANGAKIEVVLPSEKDKPYEAQLDEDQGNY